MKKELKARIIESRGAQKALSRVPVRILYAYEIWVRLVEEYGVRKLLEYPGYHDELLKGEWSEHRSSRLNREWRVIYHPEKAANFSIEIIKVVRVSKHDYRRKR